MKLLHQILLLVFFPLVISVGISIFQIESLLERLDQTIQERLRDTSEQVRNDIDVFLKGTGQFATLLAKTEEIITGIEIGDADILFRRGRLFSNIGIDYTAFADSHGKVVARGHDEFAFGDSLGDNPYFRKALGWKPLSLITPFDRGIFLISLVPAVLHEERIVGVVIAGIALDRQFLSNIGRRHNVDISVRIGGKQIAGSFEGVPLPEWDTVSFDYRPDESVIPGNEPFCTVSIFENNQIRRSSLVRLRQNILFFTYALSFVIMGGVILLVIRMLTPVKILVRAMYEYSEGNRSLTELPVPKNEIGEISRAFSNLRKENINLLDSLEEKIVQLQETRDALWGEMELAKKIQTVLLPEKPEISGYEIVASMEPAEEVGGDYYDVISVAGHDWIVIGDVSGHGVPAGLVMMMVQTAIHTVLTGNPETPPSRLLAVINRAIYENIEKMDESKHMTIVVLAGGKDGIFSFAGLHEDILIRRAATGKVEAVETDGMWIGLEPDISQWLSTDTLRLEPGDCMVLFTDGITEAWDRENNLFGDKRLIRIVEESGDRSASEIHRNIITALELWKKPDDVTLVVMKREQG